MQRYAEFAPTGFDAKGAFLDDRQEWFVVPVGRTRDSGPLDNSNFEVALDMLGGEYEKVEVHRFGHWGPGWFEIILIHPDLQEKGEEIASALNYYPVLDELDFSEKKYEEICNYWQYMSLDERVKMCQEYGDSIFAARRDDVPEECFQHFSDRITY